ncbi:MAG: RNA polymerase alpha subunit C-terminal domain-containing protein [Gemmatimonadota bacterium]
MATSKGTERICAKGHRYLKSSDCPTCPRCEVERRPAGGFLSLLSAPARRALEREGITTLRRLSGYRESELLKLHGFGPATLPILRKELKEGGLGFKR